MDERGQGWAHNNQSLLFSGLFNCFFTSAILYHESQQGMLFWNLCFTTADNLKESALGCV